MNAPFYKMGYFGDEISLVVAFFIGIGFGVFLEQGGFGSAKILVAQFYLTNLRVLKVMFSSIVTAMFGLFYLSWIGWLDLSLVYLTPTNILPQVVGGLVLGFGFVIGGYCPGTSLVATATGRIDELVNLFGIIAGIFVFGEVFPLISTFYNSTLMGRVTLSEYFNLSYGLVVFLVVVMAIGAFILAEWVEKKFAAKKEG